MRAVSFFLFFIFFFSILDIWVQAEFSDLGDEDLEKNIKKFYDDSYTMQHTGLETKILRNYDPKVRPVKDPSTPTIVEIHAHINHYSVNEAHQTLTIHGNLFMRWHDENLAWDPKDYGGVDFLRLQSWKIWQPKISVINEATGVDQEIYVNRDIIVRMTDNDKRAEIIKFPKMTITVGCEFDFADFPFDINDCSVVWRSALKMDEIQLLNLRRSPPLINLGWGDQSSKTLIAGYYVRQAYTYNVFLSSDGINYTAPETDENKSRTLSLVGMNLVFARHFVIFVPTFLIPWIAFASVSISTWFILDPKDGVMVHLFLIYMEMISVTGFSEKLPIAVSKVPSCLMLYTYMYAMFGMSLVIHFFSSFVSRTYVVPKKLKVIFLVYKHLPGRFKQNMAINMYYDDNATWGKYYVSAKPLVGAISLLLYAFIFFLFSIRIL